MQTGPVIQLQITETPTLDRDHLNKVFLRAEAEGIPPEAFVERAIRRALEQPLTAASQHAPAMAA